jgi:hypothetical protein
MPSRHEQGPFLPSKFLSLLSFVAKRRADWIGHILRKNRLLKHVIEGKTDE